MRFLGALGLSVFTVIIFSTLSIHVQAQEFQSTKYQIDSGTLILSPDLNQGPENIDVPASFGFDTQKKFNENGYVIIRSKDHDTTIKPFIRLKLDNSQLVFENVDEKDESIQKSSVNLAGSGMTGFVVSIFQQEQFKNSFGDPILSTSCDNQNLVCTPTSAQKWQKSFGFGYRAIGTTENDFKKKDSFRPFFISDSKGKSAIIYDGGSADRETSLNLNFKLRQKPQTQTGIYKGTVVVTVSANY